LQRLGKKLPESFCHILATADIRSIDWVVPPGQMLKCVVLFYQAVVLTGQGVLSEAWRFQLT